MLVYVGPCFHDLARPQVVDRGYGLQIWRVAANMLNKQSWTADRGDPPAWGLVEGLTTPHYKKETVTNPLDNPRNWTDSLVRPQKMDKDMRFGTWNVTTWSPVLRKIFGAKRDEITGEWRKLHTAELHALYSLPNIIRNLKSRRLRWAEHVARMEQSRNAYRVLVGKPESKRPLGRPRHRWEDNIKMDLREVGCDPGDWIALVEDRDQWRT